MAKRFTVTFDSRSKEVLLDALRKQMTITEFAIRGGDYSDEALIKHEEALQLFRGVLYSKPIEETSQEVDSGE